MCHKIEYFGCKRNDKLDEIKKKRDFLSGRIVFILFLLLYAKKMSSCAQRVDGSAMRLEPSTL